MPNVLSQHTNGRPALFIVEAATAGVTVTTDPSMGLRAAALARSSSTKVSVPLSARLGGEDATAAENRVVLPEVIALSRLGWAALAIGTSHAVLDYVIPYVKEREAFGEPIARRQAVAFVMRQHRDRVGRPASRSHDAWPAPSRARRLRAGRPRLKFASTKQCRSVPTGCNCSADMGYTKNTGRALVPRPVCHRCRRRRHLIKPVFQPGVPKPLHTNGKSAHGNQSRNAPQAGSSYSERGASGAAGRCCARFRWKYDLSELTRTRWSLPIRSPPLSRAHLKPRHSLSPALRPSATAPTSQRETSTAATCLLNALEISWGDIALLLSVPRRGLGNAISKATDEQLERLGKDVWAAMAITEPSFGSSSAAVSTTAAGRRRVRHQRRKISSSQRVRVPHIVVGWTSRSSFGQHPGVTVERLGTSSGSKASDTAVIPLRQRAGPQGQPARRSGDQGGPRAFPE